MRRALLVLCAATLLRPTRAETRMLHICAGRDVFCVSVDPCLQTTPGGFDVHRGVWTHTSALADGVDVFLSDSDPTVAVNYYGTQYARVPEGVTLQTCQPNFTTYQESATWECASEALSSHVTVVGTCPGGDIALADCASPTQANESTRSKTQMFRYSFTEHYSCTHVPSASQLLSSADTPNTLQPCPPVAGDGFTGVGAPCSFECTGDFRPEDDGCVFKCPGFDTDSCARGFAASESCEGARWYHNCAPRQPTPGRAAADWSASYPTVCPTTPCAPGTSTRLGEARCDPCAVDEWSSASAAACSPCAHGSYTTEPGAAECLPCFATLPDPPPVCEDGHELLQSVASIDAYFVSLDGLYSAHNTMAAFCRAGHACLPCRPGYFASASGCEQCALGTYQAHFEAHACFECALGHNTTSTGSVAGSDCLCQPGFDMPAG